MNINPEQWNENQFALFVRGIKPGAFYNSTNEKSEELKEKGYPYILVETKRKNVLYLFFQNEQLKKEFINKHNITQPTIPLIHDWIGEALGYPPLAYKSFTIDRGKKYGILYHGFNFACKEEDAEECLRYMQERYSIPKDLQMGEYIVPPNETPYARN